MDKAKKKAIEEAGFRVGSVQEFLGLSSDENRLIEFRLEIGRLIRELQERTQTS
jgi:hypothetical protein